MMKRKSIRFMSPAPRHKRCQATNKFKKRKKIENNQKRKAIKRARAPKNNWRITFQKKTGLAMANSPPLFNTEESREPAFG
jgi:hypothetical protein